MVHAVNCVKLKKEAEGLEQPPFPGELGERIYQNVSKEAWDSWVNFQTRLINEYRLNMAEAESREFVMRAMERFLFDVSE